MSYQGSLIHPGDTNWFKIDVIEPAELFFIVAELDTYFGLILYDENMNYLSSGKNILPLELDKGVYYLRLEAYPYDQMALLKLAPWEASRSMLGVRALLEPA